MRMQVILDSSFARPGSAPIWGGKKGEFRDWTSSETEPISILDEGSGRARKGNHETKSSAFPFLSALQLPKCFTTEQRTVDASLFVVKRLSK